MNIGDLLYSAGVTAAVLFPICFAFYMVRKKDIINTTRTSLRIWLGLLLVCLWMVSTFIIGTSILVEIVSNQNRTNMEQVLYYVFSAIFITPPILLAYFHLNMLGSKRKEYLTTMLETHPIFEEKIKRLSERIGLEKTPTVWYSRREDITSPYVLGRTNKKPVLIVPKKMVEIVEKQECKDNLFIKQLQNYDMIDAVLLQELSHIKNRDVFSYDLCSNFQNMIIVWAFIFYSTIFLSYAANLYNYLPSLGNITLILPLFLLIILIMLTKSTFKWRESQADARASVIFPKEKLIIAINNFESCFHHILPSQSWEKSTFLEKMYTWRLLRIPRKHPFGFIAGRYLKNRVSILESDELRNEKTSLSDVLTNDTALWLGCGVTTIFLLYIQIYFSLKTPLGVSGGALWDSINGIMVATITLFIILSFVIPVIRAPRYAVNKFLLKKIGKLLILSFLTAVATFAVIGLFMPTTTSLIAYFTLLLQYTQYLAAMSFLGSFLLIILILYLISMYETTEYIHKGSFLWFCEYATIFFVSLIILIGVTGMSAHLHDTVFTLKIMILLMFSCIFVFYSNVKILPTYIDPDKRISVVYLHNKPLLRMEQPSWSNITVAKAYFKFLTLVLAYVTMFFPIMGVFYLLYVLCFPLLPSVEALYYIVTIAVFIPFVFALYSIKARGSFRTLPLNTLYYVVMTLHLLDSDILRQKPIKMNLNNLIESYGDKGRFSVEPRRSDYDVYCTGLASEILAVIGYTDNGEDIAKYVLECKADEGGGFRIWDDKNANPRLFSTYYAFKALRCLGFVDKVDAIGCVQWVKSCQTDGGGFKSPINSCETLEDTYYATSSLAMLNGLGEINKSRCAQWIKEEWVKRYKRNPFVVKDTYFAVASLKLLGVIGEKPSSLEQVFDSWLSHNKGIVQMRVDRNVEDVYYYLNILSCIIPDKSNLTEYIGTIRHDLEVFLLKLMKKEEGM